METLSVSRVHQGAFLFLEDDNWVAPDTLHVANVIQSSSILNQFYVFTFGSHQKLINFGRLSSAFTIQPWTSSHHNIGMLITHRFWLHLKHNHVCFCSYDDYNWGKYSYFSFASLLNSTKLN